ncbi:MAG: toxin-antitoxin system toxin component, PIN family protein, partial [Candidatus Korarchaeota archaeon]|nr:toxin-antitoxin system toxin component, PIN family protein [Candidatus Korarchaeota archaeon]NIU84809.1 toxin-antitoxin system toxin component, PIN family protein [Candidatus Thorarchaeota archaeon]NIW14140.1 toxin-antitoxin system toxin component, PIN family protein [Candidatus Thorarchaeota archaeon]NIW52863.1 toxin-antitoxin system toxin component, PIN family protein [Candidatus Korarchaeota archaeon]
DPKDDMLLECCAAAEADLLITGDKDLLDLTRQELASVTKN